MNFQKLLFSFQNVDYLKHNFKFYFTKFLIKLIIIKFKIMEFQSNNCYQELLKIQNLCVPTSILSLKMFLLRSQSLPSSKS